jgi:hypothetical protein
MKSWRQLFASPRRRRRPSLAKSRTEFGQIQRHAVAFNTRYRANYTAFIKTRRFTDAEIAVLLGPA